MTKLLTLKHWQLFGLLIVFPILIEIITIGSFFLGDRSGQIFFIFPVMMILFTGLYFMWFYILGTNLYRKLPLTANMSLKRFKIFFFIPVVYMTLICISLFGIFSGRSQGVEPNPSIFALIVPIHLFSMFCMFYCLYFIAKALKTAEWQRPVTFSDYAGEFFLIWFFPIGIWIIQPRINKLFDQTADSSGNNIFSNDI